MEVMRVAFRYVRLKIEAKGLDLYAPKSVGFSCDCVVHVDPYGNARIADKGDQFADRHRSTLKNMVFRTQI